jgi:hypothetical protein
MLRAIIHARHHLHAGRFAGSFLVLWFVAGSLAPRPASALEFKCIEASRYKYLFELFGGDAKKFAAYLEINPSRLPNPNHCRAALVTGDVEGGDAERMLAAVSQNQGWLAALYLQSGGGESSVGYHLMYLARMLWLKTFAESAYAPDFYLPPLAGGPAAPPEKWNDRLNDGDRKRMQDQAAKVALIAGWEKYLEVIRGLAAGPDPSEEYYSACATFSLGGGQRIGRIWMHHVRKGGTKDWLNLQMTMQDTDTELQGDLAHQMRMFQAMDAGPVVIEAARETSSHTGSGVQATRHPRYVTDYLMAKCGAEPELLQNVEQRLAVALDKLASQKYGQDTKVDSIRAARAMVREERRLQEQCVAAAHERDRLAAYDKLCGRRCDIPKIVGMAARMRDGTEQ